MLKVLKEESSDDIKKKEEEYSEYIKEHVNNVKKAFYELCDLDDPEVLKYVNELQPRIVNHDVSKWSKEEFDPYRKNFYPINDKEKEDNKELFEKAWEHHYKVNDHHWQHWLDYTGENLRSFDELNERDVRIAYLEMVCDYEAMSYKFGDTAYDYYMSHKNEIKLYSQLEEWIINIMKKLKEKRNK